MARPSKPAAERVRDMKPTLIRMEDDLRSTLARAATINGRSLNMEVVTRLRDSVAGDRRAHTHTGGYRAEEAAPAFAGVTLSDQQQLVLRRFDKLTPDKQLALLQLLAP